MPTRPNLDMLERVFGAAAGLVEMKRQVDRVEQELRTLKAQKEGFIPPMDGHKVGISWEGQDVELIIR
jgi:DNA methyltransferase 1-associated protein 1